VNDAERIEQLRRLKNTVMGAANRLTILARDLPSNEAETLRQTASVLADVAQKLDGLLGRIRR
jgi:hypothetical protein